MYESQIESKTSIVTSFRHMHAYVVEEMKTITGGTSVNRFISMASRKKTAVLVWRGSMINTICCMGAEKMSCH